LSEANTTLPVSTLKASSLMSEQDKVTYCHLYNSLWNIGSWPVQQETETRIIRARKNRSEAVDNHR
jgi:hypothetical protein